MITPQELRERLQYEPDTGEWIWLKSPRSGQAGKPAGWFDHYGYRRIKIDGRQYIASRLAFLYMEGDWPDGEVDHINRDPSDDRWENLRVADRAENMQNRDLFSNNTSGFRGVYYHAANNRWIAQVNRAYIGSYKTIEEAVAARDAHAKVMQDAFKPVDAEKDVS